MKATASEDGEFSLLEEDAPLRMARKLRIAPVGGFAAGRRALGLMLLTWAPIAIWALLTGHAIWGLHGESAVQHYAVHVRCLVALPLLILAEPVFHRVTRLFSGRLCEALKPDDRAAYADVLGGLRRLRDSSWPWIVIVGLVYASAMARRLETEEHTLAWAILADGSLGFGGLWYVWVVRPISAVLLLGWLWRIVLLTIWFRRLVKLHPTLVASHPDRAGGIGFLELLPVSFSLVTLATSTLLAAYWAHAIVQHGAKLQEFYLPAAVFAVAWIVLLLAPLFVFTPLLLQTRHRSLLEYSTLVGQQGRLVYQRWIEGRNVGEQPLLQAPEIGPVADACTLYEAVQSMRIALISIRTLVAIVLPIALPMLLVAGLQVPLREVLLELLKLLA